MTISRVGAYRDAPDKKGAGLFIDKSIDQTGIKDVLSRLLFNPKFTKAARAISLKNASVKQIDPVAKVMECCEGLLS